MILILAVTALLWGGETAFAQADVELGASARSYPTSGGAELDLGYGVVVWGQKNKDNPLYGYVRGEISGLGSLGYSAWSYSFDVFPVAFAGVSAGQVFAENEEDYKAYDCIQYLCQGAFREDFIEGRVAGALWRIWLMARHRSSRMVENNASAAAATVHPETGIALERGSDRLRKTTFVLGFKLNDTWSVVGSYIQAESDISKQESRQQLGGLHFSHSKFSATLLGGTFESDLKKQGITGVLLLRWRPVPSVALF